MPTPSSDIYTPSVPGSSSPLRQGEFLTGLSVYRVILEDLGIDNPRFDQESQPTVLTISQACDLESDFRARFPEQPSAQHKLIPCVLFCEVATAEELFGRIRNTLGRTAWDRIKQNDDPRYQYLQKPEANCDALGLDLAEFAIDFKRYLAVPTGEVYRRIEIGDVKRRCVLRSPYLESVCQRFANYLSRVGLPEPHFSEPVGSSVTPIPRPGQIA